MKIQNFLRNFNSFYNYADISSDQFSKSQTNLDNNFNIWLNNTSEKLILSINKGENCSIDVFIPKVIQTPVFRDITNIEKKKHSEFDLELKKMLNCINKRNRKRKRLFSQEFKKTAKTDHTILNNIKNLKDSQSINSEEPNFSSQSTNVHTIAKINNKLMTKNKLDKISEEKAEEHSKEQDEASRFSKLSEINMILPEEPKTSSQTKNEIEAVLDNFNVEESKIKENYISLITSLKKNCEINKSKEKSENFNSLVQTKDKPPLLFQESVKKTFDLKFFDKNSKLKCIISLNLAMQNELFESLSKPTVSKDNQTPNFKKYHLQKENNFVKSNQFTFSKNTPLTSNKIQNMDIKLNAIDKQNTVTLIKNENNNNLNKEDVNSMKENAKIYEMLFNNKESFSMNEDSPAIDKWSNLGKIFKENYKMNLNNKEIIGYNSNNLNNIFNSTNALNVSKSLSNKDLDKPININNLPKKFFYQSETETTEENNNLMLNNFKNDNYGKVQITGYEITDRSGSSSSSDNLMSDNEHELFKKKKNIPEWANNKTYLNELIISKKTNENVIKIFGHLKISNLDLNLIFNTNKKSYKNRGDSADWKNDKTNSSKLYKEDMKERDSNIKSIVMNKLDLDSQMHNFENYTESQIYNNYIGNH